MNSKVLFLLLGLMSVAAVGDAGLWDKLKGAFSREYSSSPTIDVLIVDDQPGAVLEVKGKYHIYDPNTHHHVTTRFIGKRKSIQALSGGLKWGEEFPGVYQLHIVPDHKGITTEVDGVEYKGSLYVYDIGGAISIVNRVDVEDYLSSTLPEQFHESLPEELCAAIAIASRTNTYYQVKNPKNPYWSVDGRLVGYKGLKSVNPANEMDKAVKTTYNMVLSKTGAYEKALTPFAAEWGSATGGQLGGRQAVFSRITLTEAEEMGRKGKDAAEILNKAFPDSHIELVR